MKRKSKVVIEQFDRAAGWYNYHVVWRVEGFYDLTLGTFDTEKQARSFKADIAGRAKVIRKEGKK